MAPRRGGGGGFSFSTSSCGPYAFADPDSRVFISFSAIFFCVFLALLIFATVRLRGKPTKWFFVGSLLLALLSEAGSIIVQTLGECDVFPDSEVSNNATLAPAWLWALAVLLLIAAIMVPLCRKLGAGRFATVVLAAWLALFAVVTLARLAIHTVYIQRLNEFSRTEDPYDWSLRDMRLSLATFSTQFVGILLAAAYMIFSLTRDQTSRNGARRSFIIFLIIASISFGIITLATSAYVYVMVPTLRAMSLSSSTRYSSYYDRIETYNRSSQALTFLINFFYSLTVLAGVLLAGSFTHGGHPAAYPAPYPGAYATSDPKYGYQGQPQYPSPPAHPHYSYVEPNPRNSYIPPPPMHTASPPPLPPAQPVR